MTKRLSMTLVLSACGDPSTQDLLRHNFLLENSLSVTDTVDSPRPR